jgi:glycerol kinase
MDSMPIRIPSSNDLDVLKRPTEAPKSTHVENASPPTVEHEELHLPRGISETDSEKKDRWFIGSIDCGTTSSRFLIFNGEGVPVASHQIEFENIYPQSG